MKKVLKTTLALLLVLTMFPLSAFAATVDFDLSDSGCDYYNLIEKTDYDLAPGAVESEIVINDDTGSNRNVMHVIEVDLTNPNISVMPTYYGLEEGIDYEDSNNWASQKLTEQAAHVENDLGLNVVGGINTNLRYTSNHPYGVLVWNGVVYSDERSSSGVSTAGSFLAVSKDGVASLHGASEAIPEGTWQAVSANFGWIIKDGVSQYSSDDHSDSSRAPRTVIGIKESGELILMMNDGRQAPYSAGMTMKELAEVLLAMGCVDAVNCDGGGSSTFISEREGTGELTMKSSPSDGGQRATLGGLLVISNAVADGKFDHATVKADSESKYVTPGSTVKFTAVGADSAGGPADIPEDVTWQLANSSMGTVEDGVFTSNGTVGTATVQMVYNGNVVGEDYIEVVIPESIKFAQENITVPYGKTLDIDVVATVNNGLNTVVTKAGDFTYEISDDALGVIEGDSFIAYEEPTVTEGTLTATFFADATLTTTANLMLGRGSEVVWDFEDGDISGLLIESGYLHKHTAHKVGRGEQYAMELATAATGKVHSGNYSLAATLDYSQVAGTGYKCIDISGFGIDLTDAVALGMWIYIPTEAVGLELDINNAIPLNPGEISRGRYTEDGWYYITATKENISASSVDELKFYFTDGYDEANDDINIQTRFTIFIDDITVDYSTVVDDREAPVFSDVSILKDADTYESMNGQTVTSNTITIIAEAKEDTTKTNYTGLDTSTAKLYIDGIEISNVSCATNGTISAENLVLGDGTHTVRVEIADATGNVGSIHRLITVDADEDAPAVEFVPADPEADKLPIGSLYWMNLQTSCVEDIQKVETVIDLDGISTWELDHMEIADGFTASYTVDKFNNNATITIEKTGSVVATGSAVLASMPIRTWYFQIDTVWADCYNSCKYFYTPNGYWTAGDTFPNHIAVCVNVDFGKVTFVDDTTQSFGSKEYVVDTELDEDGSVRTQAEIATKSSWHIHTPVAVADKAATCTEDGYTGRTVCAGCSCGNTEDDPCDTFDGCGSVVDWGTTIPATGHTYEVVDGKLQCECGDIYDETGLVTIDETTYYVLNGVLVSGWQYIGEYYYYFDTATYAMYTGVSTVDNMEYTFDEDGHLVRGAFVQTSDGLRYYFAGKLQARRWIELEEGTYWADADGYIAYGNSPTLESSHADYIWYYFNEETGLLEGRSNGYIEYKGDTYYCENGEVFYGAIGVGDDIIFTSSMGIVRKNAKCAVDASACKNCELESGLYWCDENGKIVGDGFVTIDGYDYYFDNYVRAKGFTNVGEDYYFFNAASGKMYKSTSLYVGANNYGVEPGLHEFMEDGKMYIPDPNGPKEIIEEDGKLYFTIDGVVQKNGLNELDGEYYYSQKDGSLAVDCVTWVENKNDLIPEKGDWYAFDAEGKLIKTGFVTGLDGYTFYYDNTELALGFTKIGDDYYFFNKASGKMYKNVSLYAGANDYGVDPGLQQFMEDGKMYIPDPNGEKAIVEEDGILYFTIDGVVQKSGLNELDGEYYYSQKDGSLAVDCVTWVENKNDLIPEKGDWYAFDAEGKLIKTGFVTGLDGYTFYYDNTELALGFTKIGDDYYFFNKASGKMYKNVALYAGANDYGVDPGLQQFMEDGKMYIPDLNGEKAIVEEEGILYFTIDGIVQKSGLNELDGEYYYSQNDGSLAVDCVVWVENKNDLIPEKGDWYAFDAEGKLIKTGFVTGLDGYTFYYVDAEIQLGFTQVGEDYYFLNKASGKMYKDTTLYVAANDYGVAAGMYYFGTDGKMIVE